MSAETKCNTIVWDWGGVCCSGGEHFSYPPMLAHCGFTPDEMSERSRDLEQALYRGVLDETGFWNAVIERFALPHYPLSELRAGYYNSYHLYPEVLTLIAALKKTYLTTLLSNMGADMSPRIRHDHGAEKLFATLLFSHEVGIMKPDPEIFKLLLQQIDRTPAECLFIDDSAANIQAAKGLGFNTVHFQSPQQIVQQLRAIGAIET